MTREEALKTAYIKRKDTAKEEREFLNAVIKALEQESVLDKIRAEVGNLAYSWCEINPMYVIDDVLEIINKYRKRDKK